MHATGPVEMTRVFNARWQNPVRTSLHIPKTDRTARRTSGAGGCLRGNEARTIAVKLHAIYAARRVVSIGFQQFAGSQVEGADITVVQRKRLLVAVHENPFCF